MIVFAQPKDPDESIVLEFDFSPAGATSLTAPSVSISQDWAGTAADSNPSAMLSGVPQVSSTSVLQRVQGGLSVSNYAVRCTATDQAGNVLVIGAVLMVRRKPA